MSERLQKFLAQRGLGSRRQIEGWIRSGRITVNGAVAELGAHVNGTEVIRLDGMPVQNQGNMTPKRRVLAYYKPAGEVTSRDDPEGRPTVFQRLPYLASSRWIAVGRLDINTRGLLLLTNDGDLANRLMHPASAVEREYAVRVLGEVSPAIIKTLQRGVSLADGIARFEAVRAAGGNGANRWYRVTLCEGRNREVRRLWESQGMVVSRLLRIRYGPIVLRPSLRPGQWDELDDDQINALLQVVHHVS